MSTESQNIAVIFTCIWVKHFGIHKLGRSF